MLKRLWVWIRFGTITEHVKKYARLIKQRKERREAKLLNKAKRINELQA